MPEPANPQSLNRYSYVYNNPLRYTDPYGHCPVNLGPFNSGCDAVQDFFTETVPSAGRSGWSGVRWGWRNSAQTRAAAWWVASRTVIPGGPSLLDEAVQAIWNSPAVDAACGSLGPTCGVVETAATVADTLTDPVKLANAIAPAEVLRVPLGVYAGSAVACGSGHYLTCGQIVTSRCRWSCISNAVQIGDTAPVGAVPGAGQLIGGALDLAAAAAVEADILMSSCRGNVGLHVNNVVNLAVGLGGNVVSTAPNVLISGAEATNYAAMTGTMAQC